MMPDVETAGTLVIPIWLATAGAAVLAVSLLLAITRAAGVALISSLFRVGLIAVGVLAVWLYVERRWDSTTGANPGTERRSLDDRKTAQITSANDSASWPMCSVIKAVRRNAAMPSCDSVIPRRCSPIFAITPSRNR